MERLLQQTQGFACLNKFSNYKMKISMNFRVFTATNDFRQDKVDN